MFVQKKKKGGKKKRRKSREQLYTDTVFFLLMDFEFGSGGAFPEIFVPQYPCGLGAKLRLSVNESSSASSTTHATHTSESLVVAVRPVVSSYDLAKPSEEAIRDEVQQTKQQIEKAIAAKQEEAEKLKRGGDPFDPRRAKGTANTRTTSSALVLSRSGNVLGAVQAADPSPIIRSPTKKPKSKAEEERLESLTSVPFCVSSYTNRKNLIVPVEQRVASSSSQSDGMILTKQHMEHAQALKNAKEAFERRRAERDRTEKSEEERKQVEREGEAAKEAQRFIEEAAKAAQSHDGRSETREERRERIRLEKELREREKEEQRRIQRLQRTADRLGITVEALTQDPDLMRSVELNASGIGGPQNLEELVDSRLFQQASSSSSTSTSAPQLSHGAAKSDLQSHADEEDGGVNSGPTTALFTRPVVRNEGVLREMEALGAMAASPEDQGNNSHAEPHMSGDDEDDSEGDEEGMFGLKTMIDTRKRPRDFV